MWLMESANLEEEFFAYFRERHVKNAADSSKSGHGVQKIWVVPVLIAGLVCFHIIEAPWPADLAPWMENSSFGVGPPKRY